MKKLIALSIAMMTLLTTLTGCGSKSSASSADSSSGTSTAESTTTETTTEDEFVNEAKEIISDELDALNQMVAEIVESSAGLTVSGYVTPDESCFTWEDYEDGVAITGYSGEDTAIIIPETLGGKTVLTIQAGTFSTEVTGVVLPDGMTSIGDKAFYFLSSLLEVTFGASIESVGAEAFEGCMALQTVYLNSSLASIGEMAFGYCSALRSIALNSRLTYIGEGAFCMSGLESITIPGNVEIIDEEAFEGCFSLVTVEIESGVVSIGEDAFRACSVLESVVIPASVEEIGDEAFVYCGTANDYNSSAVMITVVSGSYAEEYVQEWELNYTTN